MKLDWKTISRLEPDTLWQALQHWIDTHKPDDPNYADVAQWLAQREEQIEKMRKSK